jgi:hypothetical protein
MVSEVGGKNGNNIEYTNKRNNNNKTLVTL